MEPNNSSDDQRIRHEMTEKHSEQADKKKLPLKTQQSKSMNINFMKIGYCHMCRNKGRLVYQCYKLFCATSCDKRYCVDCLLIIYKQNIIEIVQKSDSWKCPFIRKVCRCKPCCMIRKQTDNVLDFDGTLPVICALKAKQKPDDDDCDPQIDQTMRCVLKQKFKRLIQFNGTLLSKFNTNIGKLNSSETQFYNKVIYSNLKVLDNLSRNMLENNTITDQ